MTKHKKVKLAANLVVNIIANGSLAGPVREGVNIPILVVDGTKIPALAEAIAAAKYERDGDVQTVWAQDRRTKNFILHVQLLRPTPAEFLIVFAMPKQAILIDGILESGAVYLKPGKDGDTFRSTFSDESLLVDVPTSEFNSRWPARYRGALMESLRRKGLNAKEARVGAEETYAKLRLITTLRMPATSSPSTPAFPDSGDEQSQS